MEKRVTPDESVTRTSPPQRYRPAVVTPIDQLGAHSPLEFVELLQLLANNSGVSAGTVAERAPKVGQGKLNRSQVYSILNTRRGVLPRRGEQVRSFAVACGLDQTRIELLLNLWASLRSQTDTASAPMHDTLPPRLADYDVAIYQRVLGDELRLARKQRGWTRKDLGHRLSSDISLQTLATYELGTRQCSVSRLAEICLAIGIFPHDLLAKVDRRMWTRYITVDLKIVVEDAQPELLPLRRWATHYLHETAERETTKYDIDLPSLERLAHLCNIDSVDLLARLREMHVER